MNIPQAHSHENRRRDRTTAALPLRQSSLEFTLDFIASVYGTPVSAFDIDRARWQRLDEVVSGGVAAERLTAAAGDAATAACLSLMDHLPFAVAITDARAQILLANRSALRAMQARDMVVAVDGGIAAVEASARDRLRDAIGCLCAADARPDPPVVVVPLAKDASWPHLIVIALEGGCEKILCRGHLPGSGAHQRRGTPCGVAVRANARADAAGDARARRTRTRGGGIAAGCHAKDGARDVEDRVQQAPHADRRRMSALAARRDCRGRWVDGVIGERVMSAVERPPQRAEGVPVGRWREMLESPSSRLFHARAGSIAAGEAGFLRTGPPLRRVVVERQPSDPT